jgi:hypothetical protein
MVTKYLTPMTERLPLDDFVPRCRRTRQMPYFPVLLRHNTLQIPAYHPRHTFLLMRSKQPRRFLLQHIQVPTCRYLEPSTRV